MWVHGLDLKCRKGGEKAFDANTKVGIALRKDSAALKAQLEGAMLAIVKDGTYAGLLKKWNLPPQASAF